MSKVGDEENIRSHDRCSRIKRTLKRTISFIHLSSTQVGLSIIMASKSLLSLLAIGAGYAIAAPAPQLHGIPALPALPLSPSALPAIPKLPLPIPGGSGADIPPLPAVPGLPIPSLPVGIPPLPSLPLPSLPVGVPPLPVSIPALPS
ncbi:hypothetical protein K402DRAFT_136621 [Aulographum hederae CBS 113979]|uniref:Uncharacterized protein n=1 Tax=Aulographum hederae CBS 113979 TaxID=1176131 RepID=A0A6G1GVH8_9PEZI|nr:hypothetical protein K402DRAFT_136621 [Aulographum hederae CBS 113979]